MTPGPFACDRCGSPCPADGSRVEATAGPLAARLAGPVGLCGDCAARLVEFLGLASDRVQGPRKAVVDPRGFNVR